jgi:biopolymer transport protein ExbD
MQAGGNSDEGITNINVTPLVDIALVLVIIFMVTAPMTVQSGIIVNSSKVTASVGKSTKSDAIQVKLTARSILINNNKVEPDQYVAQLKALLAKNEKKLVMITTDRVVQHGTLVTILDESKKAGAKTLTLMKEEKQK